MDGRGRGRAESVRVRLSSQWYHDILMCCGIPNWDMGDSFEDSPERSPQLVGGWIQTAPNKFGTPVALPSWESRTIFHFAINRCVPLASPYNGGSPCVGREILFR